nr:penicillin-binding protein 2 [Murinocardiopsis flavida]
MPDRATAPARRGAPGTIGLVIAQVLIVAMLVVLAGRLWYLQVPMASYYQQAAEENRTQDLMVPATRGQILDAAGRPLVRNNTELVVSADFHALAQQEDGGAGVLTRLAEVLDTDYKELRGRTRLCGPTVSRPCWPGSPYQPITLAEDVEPKVALQIMERQEEFPGISAQQHAQREYPGGKAAAQVLGYLQPVTQDELEKRHKLRTQFSGVDQVGRDGLEAVYDQRLRGEAGLRKLAVDSKGNVTGMVKETAPEPGQHLVTGMDAKVQKITEEALAEGLDKARAEGKPADSGASVVLDVRTGRVVAMASVPTYDPKVWEGGIDQKTYNDLLSKDAGQPLTSRAVQGEFPPASTFKVSTLSAAVENGSSRDGIYNCPSSVMVGNRSFENYEGGAHGSISLRKAIEVSCNTVFYQLAYDMWKQDGGMKPKNPKDSMSRMAKGYGFGAPTGIDLPHESAGRIPSREWKKDYWETTREANCKLAKGGRGEGGAQDGYLLQVAKEQCKDGWVYRAGDAANFAIGQGDVLVTPLQLARAYAAIANGGTLYEPRVAKAFVSADGKTVDPVEPVKAGKLPISDETLKYLQTALRDVPKSGTARGAFTDFPLDQVPIAGKTGSASSNGKESSAWFASYAPADDPQFAVVALLSQSGTGGTNAAPVVRKIYDGIYGFAPKTDDAEGAKGAKPKKGKTEPAMPDGAPPKELPAVKPDGSVDLPEGFRP